MKKGEKKNISQRTFQGELFSRIEECIPTKEKAQEQAKLIRENPISSKKVKARIVKASCGYDLFVYQSNIPKKK